MTASAFTHDPSVCSSAHSFSKFWRVLHVSFVIGTRNKYSRKLLTLPAPDPSCECRITRTATITKNQRLSIRHRLLLFRSPLLQLRLPTRDSRPRPPSTTNTTRDATWRRLLRPRKRSRARRSAENRAKRSRRRWMIILICSTRTVCVCVAREGETNFEQWFLFRKWCFVRS